MVYPYNIIIFWVNLCVCRIVCKNQPYIVLNKETNIFMHNANKNSFFIVCHFNKFQHFNSSIETRSFRLSFFGILCWNIFIMVNIGMYVSLCIYLLKWTASNIHATHSQWVYISIHLPQMYPCAYLFMCMWMKILVCMSIYFYLPVALYLLYCCVIFYFVCHVSILFVSLFNVSFL